MALTCEKVAPAVSALNDAARGIDGVDLIPQGQLRITAPNDFGEIFLADVLVRFAQAYPKVSVDVELTARQVNLVQEGFDVGLEMSGNSSALREMISNMSHGGKIAILGIPSQEMPIDLRQVVFNMLTIKGIYGREMYETWYKMSVMLESGLDIMPVITHRFAFTDFQQGFDLMRSGKSGKIILNWS